MGKIEIIAVNLFDQVGIIENSRSWNLLDKKKSNI